MPVWVEVVLRTLTALAVLFLGTRLLGKRQITQLTYFEYITGITIGSIAAYTALERDSSWWLSLVALAVWVLVSYGMEIWTIKSRRARKLFEGEGTVLIQNGRVLENNLKKVRYTADELLRQLRKKNVFSVADVEYAELETSGELSVLLRADSQPLTPKTAGFTVSGQTKPEAVILDGRVNPQGLENLGLSRQWLAAELEKRGLAQEHVFLAQVDSNGRLYIDLYDHTKN